MFIGLLTATLVGILFGTFTGLTPGVHINLVSVIVLNLSGWLVGVPPLHLAVFIISMGITHTILDAVPSTFLGCPDEDKVLSALPAHRLLLQGRGKEAIKLFTLGSLVCLVLTAILVMLTLRFIPAIYEFLKPLIGFILVFVVVFMILKQKEPESMFWCLALFLISGILGLIVLNMHSLKQPLLPMLSGLFGISGLLISMFEKVSIPEQKDSEDSYSADEKKNEKKNTLKALGAGTLAGSVAGFFPGLGSAQAAVLGQQLTGEIGDKGFLVLVGGIGTVNFIFSVATTYAIDKARNGAVAVVLELLKSITFDHMLIFIAAALIAGALSAFLAVYISRFFARIIVKIDYAALCSAIIIFVGILVAAFSGLIGVIVMMVSTAVGLLAPLLNIPRNNAMGCLLLPVILYFLL